MSLGGVGFLWPWVLLALLLLPPLAWLYLRGLNRPAEAAALHPDVRLLVRAGAATRPLRRHLPALLYLVALALALLALARPTAPLPFPDNRTAIMLAIDVSRSMSAEDIAPSRFAAAQEAARTFVRSLPEGAKVGLVSFGGYAVLNTPPTAEHADIYAAIDQLTLERGTAIGEGLLTALGALPGREGVAQEQAGQGQANPSAQNLPPAAIVLLSDGRNNRGTDPLEAAAQAKQLAVKVFTVGLGTQDGVGTMSFGPGSSFRFPSGFDAETLEGVAQTTGGRYYEARTAGELGSVYRTLGRSLGWTVRPREVSGLVAALAGLALLGSLAASEFGRRIL